MMNSVWEVLRVEVLCASHLEGTSGTITDIKASSRAQEAFRRELWKEHTFGAVII